jgi:hypothetical protein
MARTRLLSAADHALIALSAHSAVGVSQAGAQLDRPAIALRLAELGATPDDLLPSRLTPGFGLVHALIDASLTHQVSPPAPTAPAAMPMYGAAPPSRARAGAAAWRPARSRSRWRLR